MAKRKCCKCENYKDLNEFTKNKNESLGYGYMCKACRKIYRQERIESQEQERKSINHSNYKKICCHCEEKKSPSEFSKNKHSKDGLTHLCKDCLKIKRKKAKKYQSAYHSQYRQ